MKRTSERHFPEEAQESPEGHALDLRHRFAYEVARQRARPGTALLDVGSGEGYGALIVADAVASYDGVEVSADAVAHASARYGGPSCRFHVLPADERLPFDDSSFDAVVSFQVIEHVADVDRFLTEIRRVLRSAGEALLTTPNRLLRLAPGEVPWNRFHRREFDPVGLRAALEPFFDEVQVLGVRGPEAFEAAEARRLARARAWAKLDVLGLRRRLPEPIDVAVRRLLRPIGAPGAGAVYDTSDLRLAEDVEKGLDLFAIARAG